MLSMSPECTERWFGVNCSQACDGHCRENMTCDHVSGECDRGCDAGWTGRMCGKGKYTSFYS